MSMLHSTPLPNTPQRHTIATVDELLQRSSQAKRPSSVAIQRSETYFSFDNDVSVQKCTNCQEMEPMQYQDSDSLPSLELSHDMSDSSNEPSAGLFDEHFTSYDDSASTPLRSQSPELVLKVGWDLLQPPSPLFGAPTLQYPDETLYVKFPGWTARKQRRKPKSLLRTPSLVQATDGRHGNGIFPPQVSSNGAPTQPNVTVWRRSDGDLVEPPIWAGFPSLPSFPSQQSHIISDGEKCDIYGRKECSRGVALALLAGLSMFPPGWLLLSMGYFDNTVGVVPGWAKLIALLLGLIVFLAAIVVAITLSVT